MKNLLGLHVVQLNPKVGDLEGNFKKIRDHIKEAKEDHADIVVFPELALCGYPPDDLLLQPGFVEGCQVYVKKLQAVAKNIVVILGTPTKTAVSGFYNSAAIFDDKHVTYYHKCALPNYGVFDEKRYFTPGALPRMKHNTGLFTVNGHLIGVSICEDMWVHDGTPYFQAAHKPSALINISASPFTLNKERKRKDLAFHVLAYTSTDTHFVYCNLVGGQDELVFDGGGFCASGGGVLVESEFFKEEVLKLALPATKDDAGYHTFKVPKFKTKNTKIPKPIQLGAYNQLSRIESIYYALVCGIRNYVHKNGFTDIVLGLSGGIDSAVVACLAAKALGAQKVHCISMPTQYTSLESEAYAQDLSKNLGTPFHTIAIDEIRYRYDQALDWGKDIALDVTEENIQARIRGNILMAHSNKKGWLVLTTGNKSETAMGYCTLYGDTAGGFAPLKDVLKTDVYALARLINKIQHNPIPEFIITRPPTAELKNNQTDQDTLPPYEKLDHVIEMFMDMKHDVKLISTLAKMPISKVQWIVRRIIKNEYKRRQAPPGIKISDRAFGKDWRFPITNGYHG
jgi:NAD+ synthase (glutamine-hydrolysing)